MIQPLSRQFGIFLWGNILYDPMVMSLGIYQKEGKNLCPDKNLHMIYTAVLFIIVKT